MARTKKTLTVKSTPTSTTKKASTRAKRSTKGGDTRSASKPTKSETSLARRGTSSGMRIMEYQDHTLDVNYKTDRRLTDVKLAENWAKEFPFSLCLQRQSVSIVRGVRRLYNTGRHRSGVGVPTRLSVPYDDQGQPVKDRQTKTKKVVEKAA